MLSRVSSRDGGLEDAALFAARLSPPGREQVQLLPPSRVGRPRAVRAHGADAHGARVGRRVGHRPGAMVAGRRHHQRTVTARIGDGVLDDAAVAETTQREVEHLGAVVYRPADAVGDVRRVAGASGVQHLDGHQRRLEGDASDALGVVGGLGDGSRHVRAVAVVVVGVLGVMDEVVARCEAHTLEVRHPDEGAFRLVGHACVEDGDDDALAVRYLPGLRHADELQVPLLGVQRVVRRPALRLVGEQRLCKLDVRTLPNGLQQALHVLHPVDEGDPVLRAHQGIEAQ